VLDARGRPLPGYLVEIWQCDAHGHYLAERGSSWSDWLKKREAPDPGFQGYGRTLTDAGGGYRFRTIRPVSYPGRTPHIHFKVRRDGRELLTTQMYVAGEPGNERDGIYGELAPVPVYRFETPICAYAAMSTGPICSTRTWAGVR
jgi:protocatechuate 3,4-dioxygenase, beta subunit